MYGIVRILKWKDEDKYEEQVIKNVMYVTGAGSVFCHDGELNIHVLPNESFQIEKVNEKINAIKVVKK